MILKTKKISDCKFNDPESWDNEIYLTFDVDWVPDEVLEDTLNLVNPNKNNITLFITHRSPLIDSLKSNQSIELGLHPNLNPLLSGEIGKAEDKIKDLLEIAPDAKSIRGHSLIQSSSLMSIYDKFGLQFECSDYLPYNWWPEIRAWKSITGMIKLPHFWEDDIFLLNQEVFVAENLIFRKGLKIFNFHPIHIYLNTKSIEHYHASKEFYHEPKELIKFRNTEEPGIRDFFIKLLERL